MFLFVFVTCVTAGIQVGVQRMKEALILDYRVPASVAQEVAGIVLERYVRDASWERANYTYYISSADKRIDVERLILKIPAIPNVLFVKWVEGLPLSSHEDYMQAKLKSVATISIGSGTWKQIRVGIGRYVSPLGITHIDYVVERRWFGWVILEAITSRIMSQSQKPNQRATDNSGAAPRRV